MRPRKFVYIYCMTHNRKKYTYFLDLTLCLFQGSICLLTEFKLVDKIAKNILCPHLKVIIPGRNKSLTSPGMENGAELDEASIAADNGQLFSFADALLSESLSLSLDELLPESDDSESPLGG